MPIETRTNSALFRRAEQLKRWEDSETNNVSTAPRLDKKNKIKFSDGCVFLAACAASDTEEVDRLLGQGTDINTANVDGLTALHQACIDNNLDMVQFLVEHECDVNRGDNEGWTPLHATASCGFISIARFLIENGADVAAVNNDGDLPIDIAESTEMEEYLSDVLDEQDIDCDDARSEEERVMLEDAKQMLNSKQFQERIHPRTGASALHVASAKGYIKVMNLLIQAGADLNAQDNDGWTPLHAAAHWNQKEAGAILADNLANMDIQNLAGQTCFDVAEPDLVKLLEELKKKQASMQKERPEIQAILQRTSNRPPLKRRTSVTRMSGQEKSKSVMKDTKAERAQIDKLTLPEEEAEDEKEKKPNEALEHITPPVKKEIEVKSIKDASLQAKKVPTLETKPPTVESKAVSKVPEVEKIPSWKKVLRRPSENLEPDLNTTPEVSEVILKRQKRNNFEDEKEAANGPAGENTNKDGRPFIPPLRDDESELQRKAHAKRVRETRRSTQGVLLEDIKCAELQYLINTQRDAAKRQEEESLQGELIEEDDSNRSEKEKSPSELPKTTFGTVRDPSDRRSWKSVGDKGENEDAPSSKSGTLDKSETSSKMPSDSGGTGDCAPSVTLVLRSKSGSSPEELSTSDNRTSLGTQAAIQRRRRPKRRSTGVVYLDSDDAQEEKENNNKEKETSSQIDSGGSERTRQRYGSSTSFPDTSSEVSSKSDTPSRYSSLSCSRSSLNEEDSKDFKKLYEEIKKDNERLKESLRTTEEELERTKKQLQKLSQNNSIKNSVSETEKKEKRSLERKLSEMEEEIKNISKLKTENEKLKAENRALSRVVCKLSK